MGASSWTASPFIASSFRVVSELAYLHREYACGPLNRSACVVIAIVIDHLAFAQVCAVGTRLGRRLSLAPRVEKFTVGPDEIDGVVGGASRRGCGLTSPLGQVIATTLVGVESSNMRSVVFVSTVKYSGSIHPIRGFWWLKPSTTVEPIISASTATPTG